MSDVSDIVQLLRIVFKRDFSQEWWNWKYKSNPAGFWGEKGDIWVAEDQNKLVGYWAVIPERIKLGSETVTVAQGVDAATHPDYRRLGIHKALMKKVCSDSQNRYAFIFSFPREILYKYRLKHGWEGLRLPEFLKFINYDRPLRNFFTNNLVVWSGKTALKVFQIATNLFPRHVKRSGVNFSKIQKINHFPDEINDFWRQVRSEHEICLERTATFLNWRFSKYFGDYRIFVARSIQNKNIVGYLVLRSTRISNVGNILDIVDLHVLPSKDECLLNLISSAIRFAKNERLDLIRCRIPPWHKYAKFLAKEGFICFDRIFRLLKVPQPHIAFYSLSKKEIIPKIQKWYYTLADTDYA